MSRRKADARIIQKRHRFKELRLKKGKSQRGVSLDFDVSESFIRNIENGRCNPEMKFAFRLARYFETTVDDLFRDLAD
ncbi:helix-turn-helix transcriptional regulator [Brevibacillus sp. HD3.3A]|uniref:helix-turn-helix transcriptional regulator n=1 Tax=Brevibacillus sp. HD3.3A TaxID=2738979 RepID=UPI001E61F1B8|nr:helix-turn-helix domain-containing protein [Brevibacillus sp. HD3.3A]UED70728.1 helix-turn-helix domain-containing protein [Brevibacillus sp. HD3.3A]